MTTTAFRKVGKEVSMASDSRVTMIDDYTGLPIKWFDSTDFKKTVMLDGVMYGFAGANVIFKMFLDMYQDKATSEHLLDTLVYFSRQHRIQFFIIRYDLPDLKLFAYSPSSSHGVDSPEILRISADPAIERNIYAIGSGKYSKAYKQYKMNKSVHLPIRKIISANGQGVKKAGMIELNKKGFQGTISTEESRDLYQACASRGGDLMTGGEINMTRNMTAQERKEQVDILHRMDLEAKAVGAVCASPVDASFEVRELRALGQYSVSPHAACDLGGRQNLLDEMNFILKESIS